jgi:hypothetical protein
MDRIDSALLARPPRKLAEDLNTLEEQIAQKSQGGQRRLSVLDLDAVWDDVQAKNRAAGPWGPIKPVEHQQ